MSRRSEATGPQASSRSTGPQRVSVRSTASHDVPSQSIRSQQTPPVRTAPRDVGGASKGATPETASTKLGAFHSNIRRKVNNFSREELDEFKSAFDYIDIGKEGSISCEQLGSLLGCLGYSPSKKDVNDMFNQADPYSKGEIKFQDFVNMMENCQQLPKKNSEEEMLEAFRVFDLKGNGYISAADLRHAMTNLGETITDNEFDSLLAEIDIDGDGQINYEEFVRNTLK